jgi:hypothetical protein
MSKRFVAVTAAAVGAAALAATGITYASAAPTTKEAPVVETAPVSVPMGGDTGHHEENERGLIHVNERTYSADPGGCVTVVSGLGSTSFNVRNDSKKTVEVFTGATCDNGAPIATVGPHSSANGVVTGTVAGGVTVPGGVVGSFRVVDNHEGDRY